MKKKPTAKPTEPAKGKAPAKKAPAPAKKAPAPAKKAPAPAKKAPAKKAAPPKKQPKVPVAKAVGKTSKRKKPSPKGHRRAGQKRRWRSGGSVPRINVIISKRIKIGKRWEVLDIDEIPYSDGYTGIDYTITSGSTIDSNYSFYFPETGTGSTTTDIQIDTGPGTDPMMTYTSDTTNPQNPTETLAVDLYQVDEFIEYYDPDPCYEAYQMSNGYGSWGIMG